MVQWIRKNNYKFNIINVEFKKKKRGIYKSTKKGYSQLPSTLEVLINGDGNIVLKNDKRGGPKILLSSKFSIMFNTSNTKPLLLAIVCLEADLKNN